MDTRISNGKLLRQVTLGFDIKAWVPVKPNNIPPEMRLMEPEFSFTPNFPKIDIRILLMARMYFSKVYSKYRSEAILLFHRDDNEPNYTLVSPPWYAANAAKVTYDPYMPFFCGNCFISAHENNLPCMYCESENFRPFKFRGSTHSHGSMRAFHSGTDDLHEMNQTGFHITLGKVDEALLECAPSFVIATPDTTNETGHGQRWKFGLDFICDILTPEQQETIEFWSDYVLNSENKSTIPDDSFVALTKTARHVIQVRSSREDLERCTAGRSFFGEIEIVTSAEAKNNRAYVIQNNHFGNASNRDWRVNSGVVFYPNKKEPLNDWGAEIAGFPRGVSNVGVAHTVNKETSKATINFSQPFSIGILNDDKLSSITNLLTGTDVDLHSTVPLFKEAKDSLLCVVDALENPKYYKNPSRDIMTCVNSLKILVNATPRLRPIKTFDPTVVDTVLDTYTDISNVLQRSSKHELYPELSNLEDAYVTLMLIDNLFQILETNKLGSRSKKYNKNLTEFLLTCQKIQAAEKTKLAP